MARHSNLPPAGDLTLPEPGSTTGREILSRALRRLVAELRVLPRGPALPPPADATRDALARLTETLVARDPGALASVLRRADAGTFLRCLRHAAPEELPGTVAALAASVGFELALAGALPGELQVFRPPARLLSTTARALLELPPGTRQARFANGRCRLGLAGQELDLALDTLTGPYHSIADGIVLALADGNPLALDEAHPDKSGNAVDLGGEAPATWVAALRDALDRVGRYLPALRAEMALFLRQCVPVGSDPERHVSASYREAIGTVYLSLHPNPLTMTEALVHEFSHNKLNAALELDPLLENAFDAGHASPVRPDPRPLHGVLLAVHALLPVSRLYERMAAAGDPLARTESFRAHQERARAVHRDGVAVLLAHARPTPAGRHLLDELARWDQRLRAPADVEIA